MTTLLIDGNNLTMRAQFAMRRSVLSARGVPTGPAMVAINSLARLIAFVEPTHALVAWDGGASAWRRQLDPAYKAHRVRITPEERQSRESTFMLVKEFIGLIGMTSVSLRDTEADDVIATAWAQVEQDEKIVIASSDKDFLQLLGPNPHGVVTEQIRLGSADTETDYWTADRLLTEVGYIPANWPLVTALTGDASDGVPGVPGIGPKRAVALLEAVGWNLERAQEEVRRSKPAAADRIFIDHQLVNLRDLATRNELRISVGTWSAPTPDNLAWGELLAYLERYELDSIAGRLLSGALWRPSAASKPLPGRPFGKR